MKKVIVYNLLLLASLTVFAQKKDVQNSRTSKSTDVEKLFADSLEDKFENDLKYGKLTIYLLGGIVSVIRKTDLEFEKKYHIDYHDFGCSTPSNFEYYKKNNLLIFNYLLKQHGNDWIAVANTNAFGFEKWKKDHH